MTSPPLAGSIGDCWTRFWLWVPGLVLILTLCVSCRPQPAVEDPGSVVLVTIDTLRADHLGSYGYPRDVTPFLDGLAAEGRRFENAVSSCSHTAPSHATLFTSQQPFQHGVVKNGQRLRPDLVPLAELLAQRGHETAGFASVGFLTELRQGFETFDCEWRSGDLTVNRALAWLEQRPDPARPFFLWIHLYDPHRNKGPRPKIQPDIEQLRARRDLEGEGFLEFLQRERGLDPSVYPSVDRLLDRYDTYDAGVRFADRELARLHQGLEVAAPEALWIVTSDHGEGLGNHGYDDHGKYLYREQLKVPLIVRGPGIDPSVESQLTRLVDIYPTVADWAGVAEELRPSPLEGTSLLGENSPAGSLPSRLAFGQRRPKDGARHRQSWADGEVYSLETQRYKVIYGTDSEPEFFDLESDPLELVNRAGEGIDAEKTLLGRLLDYVAGAQPSSESADAPTEHDEELRSLGYL